MAKGIVNTAIEQATSQVGNVFALAKELENKQMEVKLKFENLSLNGEIALAFIPVKQEK